MDSSKTLSSPPSRQLQQHSPKSPLLTLLLCVFLAGLHRFYVGKYGTGVLFILTGGGAGIWWAIDIFHIARGRFEDSEGRTLRSLDANRTLATETPHRVTAPEPTRQPRQPTRTSEDETSIEHNDWVVDDNQDAVAFSDDELLDDPLEKKFEQLERELEENPG